MKKFMVFIAFALLAVGTVGCGYQKVPAGYEGVKINTLGGGKGAVKTVGVGRHFYSPKYEMYLFPLFKQNYVWTKDNQEASVNDESISFQSKESLSFNTDIGISMSVNPGASAKLYIDYHKGIKEIRDIDVRNSVRDAFNRLGSKRSVEQIYGEGKADFMKEVSDDVHDFWTKQGITIHKLYLVGGMRPPKEVRQSITKKIQATQIAQQRRNEIEQTRAEAQKKIAAANGNAKSRNIIADAEAYQIEAKAKAEAEAVSLIQKQLGRSPLYIDYIKAQKWDGKLPQMVGSGAVPMININKK